MKSLKIATAQFENRSADKAYNLSVIETMAKKAAFLGANAIAFHECSVTGYSFARNLSEEQLLDIAELVPEGESTQQLRKIALENRIALVTGLFEKNESDELFKAHLFIDEQGNVIKYRKLHPFIHPAIKPGRSYCVFDWNGWKCGILICYDNNVIENVRATCLLGAQVIFMPHVTMCTPSSRPGSGFVDPGLWKSREQDPTSLRLEFEGMKGRSWLMKWLPARAYDNGVYVVFSNPIGMDDDQLKNGCSMVIDPFGDVVAECRHLGDDMVIASIHPSKLEQAGGYRYRLARKPELYRDIIGKSHRSDQQVAWMRNQRRTSQ